MRDNVTRQCPQTTTFTFEEKGDPKQIRTEVLLLTSLTPYRYAKPAHDEETKLALLLTSREGGEKQTPPRGNRMQR